MAIERNLTGFETGDQGELLYGGSGGLAASLRDVVTTVVRSGTYALKVAPSGGVPTQCVFPAGSVTGTSGTVTSGNHKRARARVYFRIVTGSWVFGNQAQRLFGFGTDSGYTLLNNGTTSIANTGVGVWLYNDGRYLVHVPPATAPSYAGPETQASGGVLAINTWYQLTFDVDYNVSANTVVTATARIVNEGGVAYDQTVTATNTIGASDHLPQVSIGSGYSGGFAPTLECYWDDLVWIATSNADATGAITLPDETVIKSFVPSATTVNQWLGTVADVDERPVASAGSPAGGDTINSTADNGTTVTFTHPTAAALGISGLRAWKLSVNAAATGAGTGLIDVILNGVTTSLTLATTFPAALGVGNPVGGLNWADLPPSAFNAATFSVVKQNGTQQTYLGNLVGEVLDAVVADPVTITTTTLPDATAGVAYNQTIAATGGTLPYAFSVVAGSLPPGLSLSSAGEVSGTPDGGAAIAPSSLANGLVDTAYSQQLSITGTSASYDFTVRVTDAVLATDDQPFTVVLTSWADGDVTYAVILGALPKCLTCSTSGLISGIPMLVGAAMFTIQATDSAGRTIDRAYTLTSTS